MLDKTDHNRLADQLRARLSMQFVPAAEGEVPTNHNGGPALIDLPETIARVTDPLPGPHAIEHDAAQADEVAAEAEETELTAPVETDPDKQMSAAREAMTELNAFLTTMPVIENLKQAKDGAGFRERTTIALKQLDAERRGKVDPLNRQVKDINENYKLISKPLGDLLDLLRDRLDNYRKAEEARREATAAETRRIADEAAAAAAAVIAQRDEAIEDASLGVETDVGTLVEEAEQVVRDAAKLARQANVAERDARVRIPSSNGGRAQSARRIPIIVINDLAAAIDVLGPTEKILTAVRQCALAYEEANGELPAGITREYERSM
jgi:hypothetical protein